MFRNDWVEEVTVQLAKAMNLIKKCAFSSNFFVFFSEDYTTFISLAPVKRHFTRVQ